MNIRKERGICQNIFLIEVVYNEQCNDFLREFIVLGSTGNVYSVKIKKEPECSCPDFITRNKRCKHIYFILIKVMNVLDVDKESYSESEIVSMFKNITKLTNNLLVDKSIKNLYEKVKG